MSFNEPKLTIHPRRCDGVPALVLHSPTPRSKTLVAFFGSILLFNTMLYLRSLSGINDIEMLSQAGLGIAMANAGQQVKDVADITSTWSNSESAVARELEVVIGCGELAGATEGSSPLAVL